jgi:hypothetical protein
MAITLRVQNTKIEDCAAVTKLRLGLATFTASLLLSDISESGRNRWPDP